MPYPNYHSARIRDPGDFLRIRNFKVTKEGIMFKGGPLKSNNKVEIQAIWFPRKKFTVSECKKWLKDHDWKYILFEEATGTD